MKISAYTKTSIFLLFTMGLVSVTFGLKVKCPKHCRCESRQLLFISCQWLGYEKVPKDLPHNVEHLSLNGNEIKSIVKGDFKNLTMLKVLSLERNSLEYIEQGALDHLKNLKTLILSRNKLHSMSHKVFASLSSLTELHLDFNELSVIMSKAFGALKKLTKLELNYNKISEIKESAFEGLDSLLWLGLSNNNISSLAPATFANLKSLIRLYLDNNKLKTLQSSLLQKNKKLTLITVHKNSFQCNCSLRWLRSVLNDPGILVPSLLEITCDEPSFIRGVPLYRLRFSDMKCENKGWTSWSSWSICNTNCGGGLRYRERTCNKERQPVSRLGCRGDMFQTESCNTHQCPYFKLSKWSVWGPCSKSCGYGISIRKRSCINIFTGKESKLCLEKREERKPCHETPCKIDGAWSQWSLWSPCSRTCGLAVKRRTRTCTEPVPQNGGAPCDGGYSEAQNEICVGQRKCIGNAKWTSWSEFLPCSVSCGHGKRTRRRFCVNNLQETVAGCKGNNTFIEDCKAGPCPVDGSWSQWSDWSRCHPIHCKKWRTRNCSEPKPKYGGKFCKGDYSAEMNCHQRECFVYSQWGNWGPWSDCSKSCNSGYRTRHRKCHWSDGEIVELSEGEESLKLSRGRSRRQIRITCGSQRTEVEECNTVSCESGTGTVWGAWGRWSRCKGGCNGKQTRKRTCVFPTVRGGLQYCEGHSKEDRKCQLRDCQNNEKKTILSIGTTNLCTSNGKLENGYEIVSKNGTVFTAKYSCKKHYKIRGAKKRTCTPEKGWLPVLRPQCIPVCGKRTLSGYGRARIFGGTDVVRGAWPWQVLIESYFTIQGDPGPAWWVRCGGSLINDEWVVTAGHCMFEKPNNGSERLLAPKDHVLYFGIDKKDERKKDKLVQTIGVKKLIVHPDFKSDILNNDIALLQLKKKVRFTEYIKPVCLPFKDYRKESSLVGKRGYAVGWGATVKGPANILQELSLPIVSKEACMKAHEYPITDSMFCAGRDKSQFDTCKGDSGGGFFLWDRKRKKWMISGVISWGGKHCGEAGIFSVYAKVAKFSRWIRRMMRENS